MAWRGRKYNRLVVVTGGFELILLRWLTRRRVVAADWLMPESTRADRLTRFGRAHFVVVRRSDMATLERRFGVSPSQTSFVPFPVTAEPLPTTDKGYGYSAGWAHRDWDALLEAQSRNELPLLVSGTVVPRTQEGLTVLPVLSPTDGQAWMRGARYVVLAMRDTDLPSGPLILLDALSHGKPVIVTDVGGSRDYVTAEVDALVVTPGDVGALDTAMRRLDGDGDLRARLGAAAALRTSQFTEERFWKEVLRD